jgi:hypothetical protein
MALGGCRTASILLHRTALSAVRRYSMRKMMHLSVGSALREDLDSLVRITFQTAVECNDEDDMRFEAVRDSGMQWACLVDVCARACVC